MLRKKEKMRRIPDISSEANKCFGCSQKNEAGLKMQFYVNETQDTVASYVTLPRHLCGWRNIAHGGVVSTLLDEAMGWTALVLMKKMLLSKTLEVEFLKPVFIGEEIIVEGSINEIISDKKALMQSVIYNKEGEVCARGKSIVITYNADGIEKMGIDGGVLEELVKVMNTLG